MHISLDVTYMYTNFGGCSRICSRISETEEVTPTKIGVHALDIDPYLHKFSELIPIN